MAIKTKSIYQPVEENDDGIRVLITRYYPRGMKKDKFDCWIRELSPSSHLLRNYQQCNYTWEQFKTEFISEIRNNKNSLSIIRELNMQNESIVITLLCYEKEGEKCHRNILKDIIENPELLHVDSVPNDAKI